MLDLDVGFIDSPLNIVRKLHNSKKDIFVQVWRAIYFPSYILFVFFFCLAYRIRCWRLFLFILTLCIPHLSHCLFFRAIFCAISIQKDLTFVMNRTVVGWRTWYTEPMPNIGNLFSIFIVGFGTHYQQNSLFIRPCSGIMLCRGNDKTAKMFDIAWKDYKVRW